jgi:hypothetical protein
MMMKYFLMAGLSVAGIVAVYVKYAPRITETFESVQSILN